MDNNAVCRIHDALVMADHDRNAVIYVYDFDISHIKDDSSYNIGTLVRYLRSSDNHDAEFGK